MLRLSVALAASLVFPSGATSTAANLWLQARTDRLLQSIGEAPGSVHVVIVEDEPISIGNVDKPIRMPAAAIMLAHSQAEIDGLIAVLLSYRSSNGEVRRTRGIGVASALAYAGLIAATGGAADPADGKDSKVIPLGTSDHDRPRDNAANPALRAARWNSLAGHCTGTLVTFLRRLGTAGPAVSNIPERRWAGEGFARKVLHQLGMLAFPDAETCPTDHDDEREFLAVRAALTD